MAVLNTKQGSRWMALVLAAKKRSPTQYPREQQWVGDGFFNSRKEVLQFHIKYV